MNPAYRHKQRRFFKRFLLWVGIWLLAGCSATPKIYTMPPSKLEGIRAEVKTVGVVLVEGSAETEVAMPAMGVWGGFKRGIYVGATVPILIG